MCRIRRGGGRREGNEGKISPQLPGNIPALEPAKWECTSASDFSFSRTENTGMIAGLGKVRKIKSCDVRSCDGHGTVIGQSWDNHRTIVGQSWDIDRTIMGH